VDNYIVPITDVKEVKKTNSVEELNILVKSGWMLLCAAASSNGPVFMLGKS